MRSLFVAVIVLGMLVTTAKAQSGLGRIGPSGAEVAGVLVGVGVGIAVVIYLVIPKQKTIEGCVAPSDHGLQITNEGSHESYVLTGEGSSLQTGTRVKLKGKVHKRRAGLRELEVRRVVRQLGACNFPSVAPAS